MTATRRTTARTAVRTGAAAAAVAALAPALLLTAPPGHAQPATPSPSPTTSSAAPEVVLERASSTSGAPVRVTVRLSPDAEGEVRLLAYSRPSTELREIRRGVVSRTDGEISWVVRPTSSTRFVAEGPGGTSGPAVLPVAPRLSVDLDEELACGTVRGRVLPVAAGRSVRVALTVDGEERVGYRRVDAAGRFVVRHCPADGLAEEVDVVVEVRNGLTWALQQAALGVRRVLD